MQPEGASARCSLHFQGAVTLQGKVWAWICIKELKWLSEFKQWLIDLKNVLTTGSSNAGKNLVAHTLRIVRIQLESISVIKTVVPEIRAVQAGRGPKSTATIEAGTPHYGPLNPPPQRARLFLLGWFVACQPLHMVVDFLREPQLLLGAQTCAQTQARMDIRCHTVSVLFTLGLLARKTCKSTSKHLQQRYELQWLSKVVQTVRGTIPLKIANVK